MEHNFKHTPGPWWSGIACNDENLISAEKWDDFASVVVSIGGEVDPEGIANTKLICAAPDLLEALIDLVVQCEAKYGFEHSSMYSEIQAAKEAIKKATE